MGLELLIINLGAILSVLFFLTLVIRTGITTPLNRRFAYFLAAVLAWLIINYLSNQAALLDGQLLAVNRLLFVISVITIATMLRFCLSIQKEAIPKPVDALIWLVTISDCILAATPLVANSVTTPGTVVGIVFGGGEGYYFTLLALLAVATIGQLLYDTIKAKGVARARATALFSAFGVGLAIIGVTNVLLPVLLNLFYLSAVGSLVVVVMLAGVGYAIIKYRLLDIRLFVARSLAYIFTVTLLALVYSGATIAIASQLTDKAFSFSHEIPYFMIAIFLGLTFQPMKRFFDKVTNRIFYHDHYNIQDVLNKLNRLILGEVDLQKLIGGAQELIQDALKADYCALILNEDAEVISGEKHVRRGHLIKAIIKVDKDIVLVDEGDFKESNSKKPIDEVRRIMRKNDLQVIVRLKTSSNKFVGCILIGHKRRDDIYTTQDLELLGLVGSELAVAVENSLRFEEIRAFNRTLQERIEDATAQLRHKNSELRKLDETKDEFVSMASHQLRTPLTSVKGYISMVLEGDAGKITKMQRQLLGEAFTSSERMVHLISDFLNVSRLQTGKFLIEARQIDLAKVVRQEVESLQTTAKAHNMKLIYREPSHFPVLYIDEGKIRQVVMNFIDNAIYYSKEHTTITVKAYMEEGDVVVTVHDTGIGVPKAEQAHLFTKFFRASNARKQRPDGTGVGLFLAKKVVTAHGGSMIFESHQGEGSTFGFRLPVKRLSAAPANDTDKLDE